MERKFSAEHCYSDKSGSPEFSEKVYVSLGEKKLTWGDFSFKWKGKVLKVPLLVNKLEKAVSKDKFPLQLAVGQVVEVNDHPNADSLYLLKVDLGKLGKKTSRGRTEEISF